MSNLTNFTKTLKNEGVAFMSGREKGDLKDILNKEYTVIDFDFLTNEEGNQYSVFILKEDEKNFYFGSSIITENLKAIAEAGLKEELQEEGLRVIAEERTNKKGNRKYTAFTFVD